MLPPFQQLIRPLPMMNARVARPTGHHTMKPRIMSAIQAGFPNSSSFATIGMKASPLMLITFTLLVAAGPVVKRRGRGRFLGKWQHRSVGEGRAIASLPTMPDVQRSEARRSPDRSDK